MRHAVLAMALLLFAPDAWAASGTLHINIIVKDAPIQCSHKHFKKDCDPHDKVCLKEEDHGRYSADPRTGASVVVPQGMIARCSKDYYPANRTEGYACTDADLAGRVYASFFPNNEQVMASSVGDPGTARTVLINF